MTSPFDSLQNYRPGAGIVAPFAVSTTAVSSAALTEDLYYQVAADVDIYWGAYSTTAVASSTTGEWLMSFDWSPPFRARSGDYINAVRDGATSGKVRVRRLG